MRITVEVMEFRVEAFQGKTGKVEVPLVACLDRDQPRLLNTFDWQIAPEQSEEVKKLKEGDVITLGVRDIKPAFGGRLRFSAVLSPVVKK